MKTEPLAAVKATLSALVDEIVHTHEAVTVTRHGTPAVVILAKDDYESLVETLEWLNTPPFRDAIRAVQEDLERGETYSVEQVAAEVAERRRTGAA
jgi:antitoxin YefM